MHSEHNFLPVCSYIVDEAQPAPTRGSLNAASINAGSTGLPGSSPLARSSVPVVRTSNDTPRPPMTSTGPPTPSGERSRFHLALQLKLVSDL